MGRVGDPEPATPAGAIVGGLPESQRMLVFFQVVKAQDEGVAVGISRTRAAESFQLSVEQVIKIEEEGLLRCWAPL